MGLDVVGLGLAKADAAKRYTPRDRRRFLPNPPVAGRISWLNNGYSNGTDTVQTWRLWHPLSGDCHDLQLVYGNCMSQNSVYDTPGLNAIQVKASIEIVPGGPQAAAGSVVLPVYFGRDGRTPTIQPGGTVISDPIPYPFTGAQGFYERVSVTVTAGQKWPRGRQLDNGNSDTVFEGTNVGTDLTDTPTPTYGSGAGTWDAFNFAPAYGALAVIGVPSTPRRTVALVGDSIQAGQGITIALSSIRDGGFGNIAFAGKAGVVHTAVGGERGLDFKGANYQQRMKYVAACTDAFVEYVSNDVFDTTGTQTFGSATANLQGLWRDIALRGVAVHVTTCTPRTTSTDSWATTANQTKNQWEPLRLQVNAWIRAGAPQNGSGTAVAPGTPGAVPNPYIVTVSDIADAVETARDSGFWKVNGSANYFTGDGTHPTRAAAAAMAAAVPATQILARPLVAA